MIGAVKSILKRVAPRLTSAAARVYNDLYHARYKGRPIAEVFGDIHGRNHWRSEASVSGPGSTLDQTAAVRVALPELCERYGIRSVLDAPCGDLAWMASVTLPIDRYVGGDIVPALVEANRARFAGTGREFIVLDLTSDPLPKVDLVFCRDCLVHLSYADITRALTNLRASGSTYLLTTSFARHENRDITTGNWRPINLGAAPFRMPAPVEIVDERCTEGDGRYGDKSLVLYRLADLDATPIARS